MERQGGQRPYQTPSSQCRQMQADKFSLSALPPNIRAVFQHKLKMPLSDDNNQITPLPAQGERERKIWREMRQEKDGKILNLSPLQITASE